MDPTVFAAGQDDSLMLASGPEYSPSARLQCHNKQLEIYIRPGSTNVKWHRLTDVRTVSSRMFSAIVSSIEGTDIDVMGVATRVCMCEG